MTLIVIVISLNEELHGLLIILLATWDNRLLYFINSTPLILLINRIIVELRLNLPTPTLFLIIIKDTY